MNTLDIVGITPYFAQMNFFLYTDTGETYGPYGSLVLAQKQARAKLAENTRREMVEIRPAVGVSGAYGPNHRGSFYKHRE